MTQEHSLQADTLKLNGFIPDVVTPDHWIMGSGVARKQFGASELMEQGHGWGKYLPPEEKQKRKFETSFCTIYGSANAYETLTKLLGITDIPVDFAERYNGVIAQISPTGGSPHKAAESFRQFGVISEALLPFSNDLKNWEEYASPNPMLEEFITLGQSVLRKYNFGHEWVSYREQDFTPGKLIAALGRGPVCASVDAWRKGENGIYQKFGPDGHWVQVVDYVYGEYWIVFDTYEPHIKKYQWDAKFEQVKLYFLSPNPSKALPHEIDYLKWLLRNGKFAEVIPWIKRQLGS